jgi:FAD/FMN-containing dehydrogenase
MHIDAHRERLCPAGALPGDASDIHSTSEVSSMAGPSGRQPGAHEGQAPEPMRPVSSWGRLSAHPHHVVALTDPARVAAQLQANRPGIAYGMGRSYGDVCLNGGGVLWASRQLDHFIAFDQVSGRLVCEAGVLLRDIQRMAVPHGWMLPVTPGTQMITVGGAIANDVHGKNHHVHGTFGGHVLRMNLARTDGTQIECGPGLNPGWYAATVGGLGLTGVIVSAELQLVRIPGPWIATETLPYAGLDDFFTLADDSEAEWDHTVSWIDCTVRQGLRGLFMRGKPAPSQPPHVPVRTGPRAVGFVPPVSLINPLSLRPMNSAYYYLNKRRSGHAIVHYEPFCYPLDHVHDWNRVYGPAGFFQYQSVVPRTVGKDATEVMLREIAASGEGSALAVLKTFGARESAGMLSFPRPGVTLALDFPNRGERTRKLFARLDAIVREAGGRIYPAKDARMPRELFERGYPRLPEFLAYRDPGISSELSRRLMGS